jgi:ATP/maltotriose-dependent transcriptional regulator MalT
MVMLDKLQQGRECYRRRAWGQAYQLFSLADQTTPLEAEDLEQLASAAYLTGRDLDFHRFLHRAHDGYLKASDRPHAARCAFWLGLNLLFRGDTGQANGWLTRAQRLVEGCDCVERGYLFLPVAERHLGEGKADDANMTAARAADIGQRFEDRDLIACARHLQGRALIRQRQVHSGLTLLDETMLAVIAGDLSPIVTGLIYCSVIEACQQVHAVSRAREWTAALAQWCEQQPQMVAFTATCLVHRAEIMCLSGDWQDAMAEACRACERGQQDAERNPPAAAFYQQGELNRLRGNFAAAEEAYRTTARLGREPQPGLALLRMAQGRIDAACAAIRRLVGTTADPLERANLLPAQVEIMLSIGDVEAARVACRELEQITEQFDTDALRATAAHAQGAVQLAEGDARRAIDPLRQAFDLWRQTQAPYEAARVRVLIGVACCKLGDEEAGALEFDAARAVFERLRAAPQLHDLDSLCKRVTSGNRQDPLTARELQVLRLIAAGKTNKAIAAELFLSERTIDRHVSNILTKLNVPSRAAATAYAYDRKLL